MKIQDVVFIIIASFLIYKQNPRWLVAAGLLFLILSFPLFSFWIFYTAQRLTYYAAAFFLAAIIIYLIQTRKK
ncbi:MAG: hypothetical protein HY427_00120 [Candidatus Levybacteria bacterium]|nr:hypothetical protein [Candidatus Levybacteria bacterium]